MSTCLPAWLVVLGTVAGCGGPIQVIVTRPAASGQPVVGPGQVPVATPSRPAGRPVIPATPAAGSRAATPAVPVSGNG